MTNFCDETRIIYWKKINDLAKYLNQNSWFVMGDHCKLWVENSCQGHKYTFMLFFFEKFSRKFLYEFYVPMK